MIETNTRCSSLCHPEERCALTHSGLCAMRHKPRCFNKPPGKGYLEVQDGWTEDGRRVMITIPNTMSKECKQWEPDGEAFRHKWDCEGCCWKPK